MGKFSSRGAGILLAVSSLPGSSGGALGEEAYRFVDFLADAGQSIWQTLPVGPVGKTLSPYQSSSAFAGNTDFIDFGAMRRDPELYAPKGGSYKKFLRENAVWLDDYALFEAVRASAGGAALSAWPDTLRNPAEETLELLREKHKEEIQTVRHQQYCFFVQWQALRRYANGKGIKIIGDLPIYVYDDSADFWLRRELFCVRQDGRPAAVAGVPPDGFSEDGQIWNNPVYAWDKNRKKVFDFWRERLSQAERLYDGVRIDHFRAFADFYAIPTESVNPDKGGAPAAEAGSQAKRGEWRPGPGMAFVNMVRKEYPELFVIAEDLGELSDTAERLVEESGFPGMKVLQFAFSNDSANPHLPHNISKNAICYTGTHDNNTLLGWVRSASRAERMQAMAYFGLSSAEALPGVALAQALASRADMAIVPLQDWLGLGAEARMNRPSTVGGRNWKWQIPKGALTKRLAARIRRAAKELYNR